jgi:predicted TIM-barrel fold metal-dependent hydrolase
MRTPPGLGVIDPLFTLTGPSVEHALAELDRFGVARAGISLDDHPQLARAALAAYPERFFARTEVDPRRGMDELRRLERLARELPLRLVTASPAQLFLPIDSKLFYPVFAKCIELDVALCTSLGVPAERVPFAPQKVERIDEVAWFFPELRIAMRGCEPWQALAVLLMRKYPNLSFVSGGVPPSELPAEVVAFANEDGAHQVWFASQPPAGESCERFYKELPELRLEPPVWPRFLRENAARILKLSRA